MTTTTTTTTASSAPSLHRLEGQVSEELRSNFTIYNQGQAIEELVLNSVDAGATVIEVYADAHNFAFEVRDNGSGISFDDLQVIGQRHATSKLTSLIDNVTTNGFRGEAIASVGTIAFMEIVTKTKDSHTIYSKMIQGGNILSCGPSTTVLNKPHGTNIYVKDLFFKLPVRKKILLASNEIEDIKLRVESMALAHPDVAISLYDRAKGTKLLQSKNGQSLLSCFAHLFGVQRAEGLCDVKASATSPWKLKLSGFASSPYSQGHHSKALQFLYINRRKVKHTPIHSLLQKLYAAHMDKMPIYAVFIECSSLVYDVCYDPDKTTIQFIDWSPVLSLVEQAFSFLTNPPSKQQVDTGKSKFSITTYTADDDDSPSCSPGILSLQTSHATVSTKDTSSSPPKKSGKPTPVSTSASYDRPLSTKAREISNSAPPFFKRARHSFHNNPSQSTSSGSPDFHKKKIDRPTTVRVAQPSGNGYQSEDNTSDNSDTDVRPYDHDYGNHSPVGHNSSPSRKRSLSRSSSSSDSDSDRDSYKRTRNRSRSRSRSRSRNRSRSRSSSRDRSRSRSRSVRRSKLSRSRSRSDSRSRSRSRSVDSGRSRSSKHDRSRSRSKSRGDTRSDSDSDSGHQDSNNTRSKDYDDDQTLDSSLSKIDLDKYKNKDFVDLTAHLHCTHSHGHSRKKAKKSKLQTTQNKKKGSSSEDDAHDCGHDHNHDNAPANDDPVPSKTKKVDPTTRKFDFVIGSNDDRNPDSYENRVKRSLDEVYRIPQGDDDAPLSISRDTVQQMSVVGQADNKFVITRNGDHLYVVDQHAADERVRLERLEVAVGNATGVGKYILPKPQRWILAPHEIRTAKQCKAQLEAWGFSWDYSPVDQYTLIVNQVPTLFDTRLTMHDFREFIAQLEETKGSSLTRPNAIGRILNSKACRGAVMFGDPLSRDECGVLIEQVVKCKLPFQCAHGRPSMHPLLDLTKLPSMPPPTKRKGLPAATLLLLPPSSPTSTSTTPPSSN